MHHPVRIKCLTCKQYFPPKSEKNIYCTRKCFKKDNYHKKKAEELNKQKFPEFTCPKCGQHIRLSFDPVKKAMKWLHYSCNGCNTLMINVSDQIVAGDKTIL